MIALLRSAARLLAREGIGVGDVVDVLGRIVEDPGIPSPVEILVEAPGIERAKLSRYPDTGEPFVLTFVPEPDARPTVRELVAAFGPFRRVFSDREMPVPLQFDDVERSAAWSVALVAELAHGTAISGSAKAERLALQREPVA